MISVLKTGPLVEPVTAVELREHLKVSSQDDGLLASLITSARLMVEAQSGVRMIDQIWDILFDDWPGRAVKLPHWPVREIVQVALVGDTMTPIDAKTYSLDKAGRPARLLLRAGAAWPRPELSELGIMVRVKTGYGTDSAAVPAPLKRAILALAAHWYETDSWSGQKYDQVMPGQVAAIVQSYRVVRI